MRAVRSFIGWVLSLFIVALFLHLTLHPLPGPPPGEVMLFDPPGENLFFATAARNTGFAEFEPAVRVVSAGLMLIAGLLLLIPFARRLGAGLSVLVLAGFLALHVSAAVGRELPRSLAAPDGATDGGAHFSIVLALLAASALVFLVHPSRRR